MKITVTVLACLLATSAFADIACPIKPTEQDIPVVEGLPAGVRAFELANTCAPQIAALKRLKTQIQDGGYTVSEDFKLLMESGVLGGSSSPTTIYLSDGLHQPVLQGEEQLDYSKDLDVRTIYSTALTGTIGNSEGSVSAGIDYFLEIDTRFEKSLIEELPGQPEHVDSLGRTVPATRGSLKFKITPITTIRASYTLNNTDSDGQNILNDATPTKAEQTLRAQDLGQAIKMREANLDALKATLKSDSFEWIKKLKN